MAKLKSLKRTMIQCAVYVLLLAVLITGVTTAKYTESTTVYPSFGASRFNTVILGASVDEYGNEIVQALSDTIDAAADDEFMPGMVYDADASDNTAKLYPFSIANGVTQDNVSEIGVVFSVKLRTAGNIPLAYSLKWGDIMLFTGAPVSVSVTDNEEDAQWTEYTFYKTAAAMANGEEASFTLNGASLDREDFTLVVEWPITVSSGVNSNSEKYMKEVELFELLVTSSSVNMSGISSMPEGFTVSEEDLYGAGIVILPPAAEGTENQIRYEIDYRSLRSMTISSGTGNTETALSKAFPLTITNGTDLDGDFSEAYRKTDYNLQLKVPAGEDTTGLTYTLFYKDSLDLNGNESTDDYIPLNISSSTDYHYSIKDGTYVEAASAAVPSQTDDPEGYAGYFRTHEVYTVYTLSFPEGIAFPDADCSRMLRLYNRKINEETDASEVVLDTAEFILSVNGSAAVFGSGDDPVADPQLCAQNRMELIVNGVGK